MTDISHLALPGTAAGLDQFGPLRLRRSTVAPALVLAAAGFGLAGLGVWMSWGARKKRIRAEFEARARKSTEA